MAKVISRDGLKSTREIQVTIETQRLQEAESAVTQKYQKAAKIKGFRPGKAPLDVVRQKFQKEINEEARESVLKEVLVAEIKERGIRPISPITVTGEERQGDRVVVTAQVEVLPDFQIPDPGSIKVERPVRKVLESDVDEEVENLRKSMAEYAPVDRASEEGDFVFVEYIEKEKNGTVVKKVDNAYVPLIWGETEPKLHEALRGKTVGHKAVIDRDLKLEGGEELPRTFEYKINSVKEEKLPELDTGFAKTFGAEDVGSLKEKIREELGERNRRDAETQVEWAIVRGIHERVQFEVPQSMLAYQMEMLQRSLDIRTVKNVESVQDQLKAMAEDIVKREIVLQRYVEQENIQADDSEVEEEIKNRAAAYNMNIDAYRKELEKRGGLESIRDIIRKRKAMDLLKSLVKMEVIIQ
jgi:trigger factor